MGAFSFIMSFVPLLLLAVAIGCGGWYFMNRRRERRRYDAKRKRHELHRRRHSRN
jgi:preprotein translocase subunit YajC